MKTKSTNKKRALYLFSNPTVKYNYFRGTPVDGKQLMNTARDLYLYIPGLRHALR